MLYFSSRNLAREFAAKNSQKYKIKDLGKDSAKRWTVKVI